MNANDLVGRYRKLRDRVEALKKEHAAQLLPFVDAKVALENMAQGLMAEMGADSIKTPSGMMYQSIVHRYTVQDGEAFMEFVIDNQRTDMLERRVAKAAVEAYADETKQLPPGVASSSIVRINFRK